jgi:oxaloacetate decarboxylase beta subunit
MIVVGLVLVTLAIVKNTNRAALPIGFGCILANLGMTTDHGMFKAL